MLICLKQRVMIMDDYKLYDYTAQIPDDDSRALIIPDFECRVSACVESDGHVDVQGVWMQDANNRKSEINASLSKDRWVSELATIIRIQAESDEEWCDMVREDQGFQYPKDDYVEQHRLRAGDVLAGHAF